MKQTKTSSQKSPTRNPREAFIIKEKITIQDGPTQEKLYSIGKFLGKGETARVYEATDISENKKVAIKMIPKILGEDINFKRKLVQEINLHKTLCHPNIVNLKRAFEDNDNVYMILELCNNETLKEILKHKGRLKEAEAKYYLLQLANALKYLHDNRILHRDIKLKNIFLSNKMETKLGDFGLSIQLNSNSERRYSTCGTIDYVAPEVLAKKGYSYQADLWSFGVVAYHLLVGYPPFESSDQRVTARRIKDNHFSFPSQIPLSFHAKDFIARILIKDPEKRLSIYEIIEHPFLSSTGCSLKLVREGIENCAKSQDPVNGKERRDGRNKRSLSPFPYQNGRNPYKVVLKPLEEDKNQLSRMTPAITEPQQNYNMGKANKENAGPFSVNLSNINASFSKNKSKDFITSPFQDLVIRWVDYSSKYGLGYMLSGGEIGVIFNDHSQIFNNAQSQAFDYFENDNILQKQQYHLEEYPHFLDKKVKLFNYFKEYLENNRSGVSEISTISKYGHEEGDLSLLDYNVTRKSKDRKGSNHIYVYKWMKTEQAIFFKMNTKLVQVVFKDAAFILIDPFENSIEYTNSFGEKSYFGSENIQITENEEILRRVKYVQCKLCEIWRKKTVEDV